MVKFTNVNHRLVLKADLQIKDMKKFRSNLEKMLSDNFTFEEGGIDPLAIYDIKITGIKENGINTTLLPPAFYSISNGPYEIENNRRLEISRYNDKVIDIFNYNFGKYVLKLVEITSNAADKSN